MYWSRAVCHKLDGQNVSSPIVTHFTIIWIAILRTKLAELLKFPLAETMILCPSVAFSLAATVLVDVAQACTKRGPRRVRVAGEVCHVRQRLLWKFFTLGLSMGRNNQWEVACKCGNGAKLSSRFGSNGDITGPSEEAAAECAHEHNL